MNVKSLKFKIAVGVGTVALAVLLWLASPFFHMRELEITGNMRVSPEEIRHRLGVDSSTNLLFFNTRAARRRVMENFYIGEVYFTRSLPRRLHIEVRERRLTAYVEHMGSILFLDDHGRVLEVRSFVTETLPFLEGLNLTRFQLGELLEVPDPVAFSAVFLYAQLLNQYRLIERVSYINASDSSNIRIIMYNIEFNVGGISQADEKIRTLVEILDNMPNLGTVAGFMDMREIRDEYFFQILQ